MNPTKAEAWMNNRVLHCVQISPLPPIQGQCDVSFRGFGTLFSKYEQANAVNMLWENPSELMVGLSLDPAKICIWIIVKSHSYNKLLVLNTSVQASKRSLLSVRSVLGHGAFCCIKSAGQTLIVFFYSWCRVE